MDLKELAAMAKSEGVTSGAVHALIEAVESMPDKPVVPDKPGKLPEKPTSPPPGQPLVPPKPTTPAVPTKPVPEPPAVPGKPVVPPSAAQKIMADHDFTPKESDRFIKEYGEKRIVAEDAKEKGKK